MQLSTLQKREFIMEHNFLAMYSWCLPVICTITVIWVTDGWPGNCKMLSLAVNWGLYCLVGMAR